MAFLTRINGLILDRNNNPDALDVVNLYRIDEYNNITSYRATTLLQSIYTDQGGRVSFSGVVPGIYDITVLHPSGNVSLFNYVVKNSYMVPEGGTDFLAESRRYVRNSETISGAGILVSDEPLRKFEQHLGYPSDPIPSGMVTTSGAGYFPFNFQTAIGTNVSGTTQMAKEFGDTYYKSNQNLTMTQNFTLKLPY